MLVVPAIIPNTKEQMEEEIKKVSSFAHLIQIDISDGIFTPVKTWPYNGKDTDYFERLKTEEEGWPMWDNMDFEVHLMVKSPELVLEDWIRTGVKTIIAHIEATENFQNVLDICKSNYVSVGLALKPSTNIEKIRPYIEEIDFIQVMGSDKLGNHGEELTDEAVEKTKEIKELFSFKTIAVDIGVNLETKVILKNAGADKLISGGAILNSPNPQEVYSELSS